MVLDSMIVFRFAICLNFLFSTYKYYDRTFMNLDFRIINSEIFYFRNPQSKSKDRGIGYWTQIFFQIISSLPDFRFPIFRISETGNIVLYFNNVHLYDFRLFLFHIGKRVSHMVFDWMIISQFAICLNFLITTYKYHDRTFMNWEMYATRERN